MSGRIGIPGRHIAQNCLGVLACVHAAGGNIESAFQDLSHLSAGDGRGRKHEIFYKNGALKLIDESYNASPISIRAALKVLGADKTSMRRVAILGDMRELGAQSESLHVELAGDVAANADIVFACGPYMRGLFDALPESKRGAWANDSTKLAPIVGEAVRPGDVVVVKGSNGSAMGIIVRQLLAQAGA
jgi:UDP-N-acetylmuramoyl-tripeptide--D-alanyl-D-alanine ligase